jgi:two-component system, cell cycle response regulator DivK
MARILLVEDNELNRDMLSRRLERLGYEVMLALDGQDALQRAASSTPDLVLMDMDLPVLSGWEATRVLKERAETSSVPVIALTAHALTEDRDRALEAGCDAYQSKPVDFSELVNKMEELLASRGRP